MAEEVLTHVIRISSDSANAALAGVANQAKNARQNLDNLDESGKKVTSGHATMAESVGRATGKIAAIGGALQVLDPRIGAVVNGLTEATNTFTALGVSGGSFLAVAAPIAAAVAVLALAYKRLAKEAAEAEAKQKAAAEAATKMQEVTTRLGQQTEIAELQARAARGEIPEEQVKFRQAELQAEADYADVRADAERRLVGALKERIVAEERIRAAREQVGEIGAKGYLSEQGREQQAAPFRTAIAESEVALQQADARVGALQQELAGLDERTRAYGENLKEVTRAQVEDTKAKQDGAEAQKAKALAAKEEADRLRELYELLGRQVSMEEQVQAIRADAREDILTVEEKITDESREQLRILGAIAVEARKLGNEELAAKAEAAMLDVTESATRKRAAAYGEKAAAAAPVEEAKRANFAGADVVGGLLAGDVGGAMAALGPVGLVAQGAITIGQAGGAAGVREQLVGIKDALLMGIRDLPEIIGEVLPDVAIQLAEQLPPAILEALPEIVGASLRAQYEVARFVLTELPGSILDALVQALERLRDRIWDSVTGADSGKSMGQRIGNTAIDVTRAAVGVGTLGVSEIALWALGKAGVEVPRFASGTDFVQHSGLAWVDKGEEIRQRGGPGSAGGTTVFQISGGFYGTGWLDDLDRAARIETGRGLTWGT